MKLIKIKNNRRGVLLFGVVVLIAILGILYFKGFTLFSTETRRHREEDLDFKLSQMRRAVDDIKMQYEKMRRDVNESAIYDNFKKSFNPSIKKYQPEMLVPPLILTSRQKSQYEIFAEYENLQEEGAATIGNPDNMTSNGARFIQMISKNSSDSVYLRQAFEAPMLDVDTDGKWNVGWRIAVNRVNSSSFEGGNFKRIYKIIDQSNVAEVNQWWFATTTENSIISIVDDFDRPQDSDYPGQKDSYGTKGKYGKNVLRMTVK
ncbi:MAG TPA: hypothetical protein PKK26_16500 [Candidatus Wallbacteria bacterium]|nr:hypothetical protein [Candidatus Wallbacteria bacterium]